MGALSRRLYGLPRRVGLHLKRMHLRLQVNVIADEITSLESAARYWLPQQIDIYHSELAQRRVELDRINAELQGGAA